MELTARPYRNDMDRAKMRQLLVISTQANISASYMHPGVLDRATRSSPDEQANRRNVLIWERDEKRAPLEFSQRPLYGEIFIRSENVANVRQFL